MKEVLIKLLENSYTPYYKYPVSAAVVTKSGEIIYGVNIETSSPANYKLRDTDVYITVSNSGVEYTEGVIFTNATGNHHDIQNNIYTLDISNQKENTLRITKTVSGIANYTNKFTFTLELNKTGLEEGAWNCQIKSNNVTTDSTITFSTTANGLSGTFEIGDGEEFIIELPYNTEYTVTEEEDAMFWTSIGSQTNVTNTYTHTITESETVNFENHANSSIPTLSYNTLHSGMCIMIFGAISLLAFIIFGLIFKKKHA